MRQEKITKGLLAMGMITGFYLNGCSDNRSVYFPEARAGSASDIHDKLLTTQALRDMDIKVDSQNGKNILLGAVHTQKQRFLAGSVARSVEGSGIVVNRLVVE